MPVLRKEYFIRSLILPPTPHPTPTTPRSSPLPPTPNLPSLSFTCCVSALIFKQHWRQCQSRIVNSGCDDRRGREGQESKVAFSVANGMTLDMTLIPAETLKWLEAAEKVNILRSLFAQRLGYAAPPLTAVMWRRMGTLCT